MAEEDRLPREDRDGSYKGRATFIDKCGCGTPGCNLPEVFYRDTGKPCPDQTRQVIHKLANQKYPDLYPPGS